MKKALETETTGQDRSIMSHQIKRVVNIAKSFKEAENWDMKQQLEMTPDERFAVAKRLQEMFYGKNLPDVREWYQKK